jgi:hypothetical protein
VTDEQRRRLLQHQVDQTILHSGFESVRLEGQSAYQATLLRGQPINHVVHGVLSLLTCGLWLFVWLIVGLAGGPKREQIFVDEWGGVHVQQLGRA